MSGNPRSIVGIDKRSIFDYKKIPMTFYYDCKNCGNKWEEIHEVSMIAGRAGKSYDYCSECYPKVQEQEKARNNE